MSGGLACICTGPKLERHKHWRVYQRRCNHSAFSGYRRTPSDYSSIRCMKCGRVWRTKAGYVYSLPDITDEEARRP